MHPAKNGGITEQRRAVEAKLDEMIDEMPSWAQSSLTHASRKTADQLLASAEIAALRLVAFNIQACAWIRGDALENGEKVQAPPNDDVMTCAAQISLNLRLVSIIARGEMQFDIADQLAKMSEDITPTIFPLAIRPEPIAEARESLAKSLRQRAERLERFDDAGAAA